ncbi:MAG: LysE family translocator [Deltaproteobacteria bacterium]|nr:LysE family translocator [Deltaproteobacteria bacterium]
MEQILVVIGITFLVMVSPGPDLVIVTRNTLVGGRAAGLWSSLGVLVGNAVHMTYCLLGIGWLISQSIVAFSVLKFAGAAYLIYLGIATLRADDSSFEVTSDSSGTSDEKWFVQGLLNNVLNPKGSLFYLGVFTMVITPETSLSMTLTLILCMKLVSSTFWLVFVYTLDQPIVRRVLERSQRTVNRVFGALLIGLGLRIAAMER